MHFIQEPKKLARGSQQSLAKEQFSLGGLAHLKSVLE